MTRDGWRALVLEAVRRADAGDPELLDLAALLLEEQDRAKADLQDRYGCGGMGWPHLVEAIHAKVLP